MQPKTAVPQADRAQALEAPWNRGLVRYDVADFHVAVGGRSLEKSAQSDEIFICDSYGGDVGDD